ncbi:MAG TPA: cytochrome c oxidase subunit I [Variovorax sp.]|nr:cytochrome c oxidase subunit I [Variovorax sp.]
MTPDPALGEARDRAGGRDGPRAGPLAVAALRQTWSDPPGFMGMLEAIDHKTIARRFIIATLVFFLLGGLLALLMRVQLARPQAHVVGPEAYNQLFTMHGSTMMFLFAVPVMQAVAAYLVPLMVGARSIAFPRLNAFAYWIFVMGGAFLYLSFALGAGPNVGWFAYVPLSSSDYAPGKGADIWAQMITFTELASLLQAIVLITTILKMRTPGMRLDQMPLFVWATLVTQFMVLFAMPAVMIGSSSLILDRLVSTHFFNPARGGDVLLWQHLFWFFGHPEVYLIFIPPLGFISSIVSTFSRRPIFGYRAMVLALIATAFLAFSLWVHHMFATNLPEIGKSFFTAASLAIAVPSAVQIFCWIATLWNGRLDLKSPLYFVLAFFVILVLGGLTGIVLGSVPLDLQVHDTYFVVAHLHYVLLGGGVFPLFGAFYFWFPKLSGRMLSEAAGKLHFWLFFVGFNLTFFPMHLLGLNGMQRRIWTYPAGLGWDGMNLVATVGAFLIALSVLVFILNVIFSLRRGAVARANPWGAGTLEWSMSSPPAPHNFDSIPVVHAADPLWSPPGQPAFVSGLATHAREVLATTAFEARPDSRPLFPSPTAWPFWSAVATTVLFVGSVFSPWAVVWASLPLAVALICWFWPKPRETSRPVALEQRP